MLYQNTQQNKIYSTVGCEQNDADNNEPNVAIHANPHDDIGLSHNVTSNTSKKEDNIPNNIPGGIVHGHIHNYNNLTYIHGHIHNHKKQNSITDDTNKNHNVATKTVPNTDVIDHTGDAIPSGTTEYNLSCPGVYKNAEKNENNASICNNFDDCQHFEFINYHNFNLFDHDESLFNRTLNPTTDLDLLSNFNSISATNTSNHDNYGSKDYLTPNSHNHFFPSQDTSLTDKNDYTDSTENTFFVNDSADENKALTPVLLLSQNTNTDTNNKRLYTEGNKIDKNEKKKKLCTKKNCFPRLVEICCDNVHNVDTSNETSTNTNKDINSSETSCKTLTENQKNGSTTNPNNCDLNKNNNGNCLNDTEVLFLEPPSATSMFQSLSNASSELIDCTLTCPHTNISNNFDKITVNNNSAGISHDHIFNSKTDSKIIEDFVSISNMYDFPFGKHHHHQHHQKQDASGNKNSATPSSPSTNTKFNDITNDKNQVNGNMINSDNDKNNLNLLDSSLKKNPNATHGNSSYGHHHHHHHKLELHDHSAEFNNILLNSNNNENLNSNIGTIFNHFSDNNNNNNNNNTITTTPTTTTDNNNGSSFTSNLHTIPSMNCRPVSKERSTLMDCFKFHHQPHINTSTDNTVENTNTSASEFDTTKHHFHPAISPGTHGIYSTQINFNWHLQQLGEENNGNDSSTLKANADTNTGKNLAHFPCKWDECKVEFDTLLDLQGHMLHDHVDESSQNCEWLNCEFHGDDICSLVNHINDCHGIGFQMEMANIEHSNDLNYGQQHHACIPPKVNDIIKQDNIKAIPPNSTDIQQVLSTTWPDKDSGYKCHEGNSLHRCKWSGCNETFKNCCDLDKHLQEFHLEKGKSMYNCLWGNCNKSFKQRQKLQRHLKVHSCYKGYKCDVCDKSFSTKDVLRQHMNTHNDFKLYTCAVCHKGFNSQSSLKIHFRIHTGEKPLSCKICGKKFNEHSNLSKHIKTHMHKYKCPECTKSFNTLEKLNNHQQNIHHK
ncbi:Zap1p SCDLUD_003565 [Saccharomycodes ludwigii]|uniref:Zap1p n=1 Tax=Saccharomycodes ludwigii TaxID=36035 RepID=UPI001E82F08D|nr:hypothetical protein SCDLUD_003565 [Saccharomycodes ludwigii]KAH3900574.1 hypothetical protein SCDLUD_003565 [Saccharomycodes ludwigii]